jgi:uncharacterized protein (UPF0276 family)
MNLQPLAGIGLRSAHYQQILDEQPTIDWLEAHSENFFMKGGPVLDIIKNLSELYPISLHGIGLSLGSSDGIDISHLTRLQKLIELVNPFLISEHLSWNQNNHIYVPDLLPVPYTRESLDIFSENISKTQDFLKREILIENPSTYLEYSISTINEPEFLTALVEKTGAKILLDVNNIFVSSSNHGWNAKEYIEAIPKNSVREIHLAGHSVKELSNGDTLRIDTHDNFVSQEVWDLFAFAQKRFGNCPTLIEWDDNLPSLEILVNEAMKINKYCMHKEAVSA